MALDLAESQLKDSTNTFQSLKGKEQIIAGVEETQVVLFLSLCSVFCEIGFQNKRGCSG